MFGRYNTHRQEHKTSVTTASGNRYTVIDRVRFADKDQHATYNTLKLVPTLPR
jgi:hypothetical protein